MKDANLVQFPLSADWMTAWPGTITIQANNSLRCSPLMSSPHRIVGYVLLPIRRPLASQMYSTMNPATRAPPKAAYLSNFTNDAPPKDDVSVAAALLMKDQVVHPLNSAKPLVANMVALLPVRTPSLDVVKVALGKVLDVPGGVLVPVRTPVVGPLVAVPETTAIVEGVGTPRMETVPNRSVVDAAFTSGPAERGKPNTLQMLAMAPKVATQA